MNLRAASLFLAFSLAALPIQAQSPPTVQSLASDLAALADRVAKLEGKIVAADLVGTYALNGFQIELSGGPGRPPQVSSYVFVATVTLNADGTGSIVVGSPENGNTLAFTAPPSVSIFKGSGGGGGTGTWTYLNGYVTFDGGTPPLSVAAGGRILVGTSANHDDGTDVILILTRLQ